MIVWAALILALLCIKKKEKKRKVFVVLKVPTKPLRSGLGWAMGKL